MITGKGLPFDTRIVTRAGLNVGSHQQVRRAAIAAAKRELKISPESPFSGGQPESKPPSPNDRAQKLVREVSRFLQGFFWLAFVIFFHDLFDLGRTLSDPAEARDLAGKIGYYSITSIEFVARFPLWLVSLSGISIGSFPELLRYILSFGAAFLVLIAAWGLFHILMYGKRRNNDSELEPWERRLASFLVAAIVVLTVSRLFAIFENLQSTSPPPDYLTVSGCQSGYSVARFDSPRYLRLDNEGAGLIGDATLSLGSDIAQTPLVFSEDGDFGLVKRGDGVKPVAPVKSNAKAKVEPAFVSVQLCVRDGTSLPAVLSAATLGRPQ